MKNEKQATQTIDLVEELRTYTKKYGVRGNNGNWYIPSSWLAPTARQRLKDRNLITKVGTITKLDTTIPRRYNGRTVFYLVESNIYL